MKSITRIVWGVLLIGLGIIFGLNAMNITNINVFFNGWWTLFIIVPSFVGLLTENDKTGNLIGLLIGIVLLLAAQDFINFGDAWKLIFPIILVLIGVSIIFKDSINGKVRKEIKKLNKNKNEKSYCSTFGSQKIDFDNETFDGCDIDAIFGGVELDLRNANVNDKSIINANTVFGGIELFIPKDVIVKVSSTPIFGGVDNKHTNFKEKNTKTIYVNASCVFGGVNIK